ncbi:hypothetical protein B6I21_00450 [candidate division KSB1 bacterium 4572_119]|nr:MAG: hypothetical protein B6I21_00450 [candidate division KSB1 bacterium 4572_119]
MLDDNYCSSFLPRAETFGIQVCTIAGFFLAIYQVVFKIYPGILMDKGNLQEKNIISDITERKKIK